MTFCGAALVCGKRSPPLPSSGKAGRSPSPPLLLPLHIRVQTLVFRTCAPGARDPSLSATSRLWGHITCLRQFPYRPLVWLPEGEESREPPPLPAFTAPPERQRPSPPRFSLLILPQTRFRAPSGSPPYMVQLLSLSVEGTGQLSVPSGCSPFFSQRQWEVPWGGGRGEEAGDRSTQRPCPPSVVPFEAFLVWGPRLLLQGLTSLLRGNNSSPKTRTLMNSITRLWLAVQRVPRCSGS